MSLEFQWLNYLQVIRVEKLSNNTEYPIGKIWCIFKYIFCQILTNSSNRWSEWFIPPSKGHVNEHVSMILFTTTIKNCLPSTNLEGKIAQLQVYTAFSLAKVILWVKYEQYWVKGRERYKQGFYTWVCYDLNLWLRDMV